MAGYAIGKSMNFGFPGTYARTPDDVIMSRPLNADKRSRSIRSTGYFKQRQYLQLRQCNADSRKFCGRCGAHRKAGCTVSGTKTGKLSAGTALLRTGTRQCSRNLQRWNADSRWKSLCTHFKRRS